MDDVLSGSACIHIFGVELSLLALSDRQGVCRLVSLEGSCACCSQHINVYILTVTFVAFARS